MYYIDTPDEIMRGIVAKSFPGYAGRKFSISTTPPLRLTSCWDGGSRNDYVAYHLSSQRALPVGENGGLGSGAAISCETGIPAGWLLVEHRIFCGRDMGITIYAAPETLAPMLPAKVEVDADVRTVLFATRSLKSSYAGDGQYRFTEAKRMTLITRERWDVAKVKATELGLLDKRGAITAAGKNAISDMNRFREVR